MARGPGQRAMRIAILAGALGSLVQLLPEQPLREQLIDLATQIETEADNEAASREFSDDVVTVSGIRAA